MNANRETADNAIEIEWQMFDAVNKGKARADCQDDYKTFYAMRSAQLLAWSAQALESYLYDLSRAAESGRNLIAEKYIHMMKTIQPAEHKALQKTFPPPSESVKTLARKITDELIEQTRPLFESFPYIAGAGRPLYSSLDSLYATSIETYQYSELLTFSEKTLNLIFEHMQILKAGGKTLARVILENTVGYYGYAALEDAEAAAKARTSHLCEG